MIHISKYKKIRKKYPNFVEISNSGCIYLGGKLHRNRKEGMTS